MKNLALNISLTIYLLLFAGAMIVGVRPLIVASNSMAPAINKGDLLLVQKQKQYLENEVISFKQSGGVVTHRILKQKDSFYQTKGDGNQLADSTRVGQDQIIGKVIYVLPLIGFVLLQIKSKHFVFLFIFIVIYVLVRRIKDAK